MEIDSSDDNNGNMTGLRKNDLTLWPVSANASGEGLPYAPINFPNLGDNWSWKAGKRIGVSGHFLDRYLYLPTRLQNKYKKRSFASKLSVEQYIRTTFPGADSDAFFASFSWRITADNVPSAKGDKNEAYDSPVRSEEMVEYSALDSQSDTVRCKAGNKMCNSITSEAEDSSSALMLCDVCCSEPGFCRDCCCILCCKTVTSAYGSYSYIKCEAMVSEGYICGHVAHMNCALQAFMAGKVGGNIGLDAEYYCRRCDARTDLVLHVKRILQVCESIDSRDEIEKILNVGLRILHGSQKATARRLLYRIESAMAKLKCGTCLEDIWKVEDNVLAFSSGKAMPDVTNHHHHQRDFKTSCQQIMSTSSDHRFNSLKLDYEIDHVLQALKKSQESEYKIAKEKLCAQKNHLHNLYQQLNKERSELGSRTSPDQDACLDVILNRMDQIKREVMKFNDMEEVAKGFGRTSKAMLKQHFGFGNDD